MSSSVLGHLTLGYQLVWNRQRQVAGVLLFIEQPDAVAVDAAHLLATLAQAWSSQSPQLILCVQSEGLLRDLLEHAATDGPWIAVPQDCLPDPVLAAQVCAAHARGLQLVLRGDAIAPSDDATASCFSLVIAAYDAALAPLPALAPKVSRIVQGLPSRALVDRHLDAPEVWGVAGWPVEDAVHGQCRQSIPPDKAGIARLVRHTDTDVPLEVIEHTLDDDPVLVYRFLLHINSPALGLRSEIESLRHGLMMLGLSNFKRWLLEQSPTASDDLDLQPVRKSVVVRARLTEQLLDAGDEDELRSEIYLCGLMSQIDLVLGESMASALQRLPLSERITSAIRGKSGPYAPYLAIAAALEYPHMKALPQFCETHQIDMGDVNRVLLRVLAQVQPRVARGR